MKTFDALCPRLQTAAVAINADCAAQLEYAESHVDAGGGYAHIPLEAWDSALLATVTKRAAEFDIDLSTVDDDTARDIIIDNIKMESGHYVMPSDSIVVMWFPVGEVETQVDYAPHGITRRDAEALKNALDCYIGGTNESDMLCYMTSDSVWYAVVSPDDLAAAIAALSETE